MGRTITPLPDGLPAAKSHTAIDEVEYVEFDPTTAPTLREYLKAFAAKSERTKWPYVGNNTR